MAAEAMDRLAIRYADRGVASVFIYTREAHPGENYGFHRSMEDKRKNAQSFIEHSHVRRPILLDSLEGKAHRAYGMLPNMVWIISRGGIIQYKASWTDATDVENSLTAMLDGLQAKAKGEKQPFYSERLAYRNRNDAAFRSGLERSGPKSVTDFYGR